MAAVALCLLMVAVAAQSVEAQLLSEQTYMQHAHRLYTTRRALASKSPKPAKSPSPPKPVKNPSPPKPAKSPPPPKAEDFPPPPKPVKSPSPPKSSKSPSPPKSSVKSPSPPKPVKSPSPPKPVKSPSPPKPVKSPSPPKPVKSPPPPVADTPGDSGDESPPPPAPSSPPPPAPSPLPSPPSSPLPSPPPTAGPGDGANVFDITKYGAKSGGGSDASGAIVSAFKDACAYAKSKGVSGVVLVPEGTFAIKPFTLRGPDTKTGLGCGTAGITLQLDGTLVAPARLSDYPPMTASVPAVVELDYLDNLVVQGSGAIDGQGAAWWAKGGSGRPVLVYVHHSDNVVITDITLRNSTFFHISINHCVGVTITRLTTDSPEDSLNTDGIHVSQSSNLVISNCTLATGDDNVSIFDGTTNIDISDIVAPHGHGISIGSLGSGKSNTPNSCVGQVRVRRASFTNTLTAFRIKSWQGGLGAAYDVDVQDVTVDNVRYPLVLDQFYAGGSLLREASPKNPNVAVSKLSVRNLSGTSRGTEGIFFRCGADYPCSNIALDTINLRPVGDPEGSLSPVVRNVYGSLSGAIEPPLSFTGSSPSSAQQSNLDIQLTSCGYT